MGSEVKVDMRAPENLKVNTVRKIRRVTATSENKKKSKNKFVGEGVSKGEKAARAVRHQRLEAIWQRFDGSCCWHRLRITKWVVDLPGGFAVSWFRINNTDGTVASFNFRYD